MSSFFPVAQRRQLRRRVPALLKKQEKKRGLLIAFEGPDGAGKTTQRKLFQDYLKGLGHKVVTTKWNSSALVKPLIKARKTAQSLGPEEFSLLHAADFRHRLELEVMPSLWKGRMVVADRYLFTALARDSARGLDLHWLMKVYSPILWPDIVFYFSVTAETSARRISAERAPKFYEAGQDVTDLDDPLASYQKFMSRVISEYEALALIFEFVTIDAERTIHEQHKVLRKAFEQAQRKQWTDWNAAAVTEWLDLRSRMPEMGLED